MRANHRSAELRRRLPRLFLGATICGWGIACMVVADLGLGPWDVFHQGLSHVLGIPIGMTSVAVGLALLMLWIPLRVQPGVGTLVNAVGIGVVIDIGVALMQQPSSLWLRGVMMALGPLLFGVGSGFYIGAGLGPGPRDGIMIGIAARGYPIAVVRTGLELIALVAGGLLGGRVGVGTLVFAFGVGPVVHVALPWLSVKDVEVPPGAPPPGGPGGFIGETGR